MQVKMPKKYFYFDTYQVNSFYEQLFIGLKKELCSSSQKKSSTSIGLKAKLGKLISLISPIEPEISGDFGIEHSKGDITKTEISEVSRLDEMIDFLSYNRVDFYFNTILGAVEYCEHENTAIVNVKDEFDIVDYFVPGKNAYDLINENKQVSFIYSKLDQYDASDDYFKKPRVSIAMTASISRFVPARDYLGATSHEGTYFNGFGGKNVRLEIFGQLSKANKFYQIKPFAISY
jgi:hypothetical protein